MKVVLDANLGRHTASSGLFHVEDEVMRWGPHIMGLRHYDFRYRASDNKDIAQEVRYVPALAIHGPSKGVSFHRTQFVDFERLHLRPAIDWARRSIDGLFKIEPLRTRWDYSGVVAGGGFDLKAAMRRHIEGIDDDRLKQLLDKLGRKSSQDAYLLWISERAGVDVIVTLDLKWVRKMKQLHSPVAVVKPSELCMDLEIPPVSEEWFSASDPFSHRIETLFQRRASRYDLFLYRLLQLLLKANRKLGLGLRLKFPT